MEAAKPIELETNKDYFFLNLIYFKKLSIKLIKFIFISIFYTWKLNITCFSKSLLKK